MFGRRHGEGDDALGLSPKGQRDIGFGRCIVSHELEFPNALKRFSHPIDENFHQQCVISLVRLNETQLTEYLHVPPSHSPF